MKIIIIFWIIALFICLADLIKNWKNISYILKPHNLRWARISKLKQDGHTWVGYFDATRYMCVVEFEEYGEIKKVPTLHYWYLTKYNKARSKKIFMTREQGKQIEIYYSQEKNCAIIKKWKYRILIPTIIESVCAVIVIIITIVFFRNLF